MANVKKNLVYQSFYRILSLITPLITSPYLSRVLGAGELGRYSYTMSIVSYFNLFAALGTEMYGTREIAKVRAKNSKEIISETFWGIYIVQMSMSLLAMLSYFFFIRVIYTKDFWLALIQGIWIMSTLLDINWFFFGMEEFKYTVVRNCIVKIVGIVFILLFVRHSNDLLIYAFIMGGTMVISQLMLWAYMPKYVIRPRLKINMITMHIIPNLKLFIPLIGSSVYWTMDKTMLGIFSDYNNVGYYYNADKVMNIPLNLIIGIGTVMLPRMTYLIQSDEMKKWKEMFDKSVELYIFMAAAIGGGIAAIANEFVPFFFGSGYDPCVYLIIAFAPILLLKALNDMLKNQYIIPSDQEKVYTYAVFGGAISNFFANYFFIKMFGAFGALIATGVAEVVVFLIQDILCKDIKIMKLAMKNFWYIIFAIAMYFCVRLISSIINTNIYISLLAEIIIGALVYILLCILYWKITKRVDFHAIMKKKRL